MSQPKHLLQLKEEFSQNSNKKVFIFNPTTDDFVVEWSGVPYLIPSLEVKEFDFPLAQHIKKHLLEFAFNKSGGEISREELLKQIETNV